MTKYQHMLEVYSAYKADPTKLNLLTCIDAGWKVQASENVGYGMDTCDPFTYDTPEIIGISKEDMDTMYICFL